MYQLGNEKPWHMALDYHRGVNFCVWVLRYDGLHVLPFDQHPDGTGILQAAGMTAEQWRFWFSETMIGQRMPSNPALGWRGSAEVRERLRDLWTQYQPIFDQWREQYNFKKSSSSGSEEQRVEEVKQIWDDLVPFHQYIPPPLLVYYIDYPSVIYHAIRPSSVIIGAGIDVLDHATYRTCLLRAVRELSNQ